MLSNTTWLVSKMDSVKYIFKKLALTWRIARWQVLLSEFRYCLYHSEGNKRERLDRLSSSKTHK